MLFNDGNGFNLGYVWVYEVCFSICEISEIVVLNFLFCILGINIFIVDVMVSF